MKTKIVYVLVSSPLDIYLEQAYVSMHSLRHYMPDVNITLITDRLTAETFTEIREKETKYVNEMIVVDLDENSFTPQQRSRQLKTSIRNRVEGDFLYIDCDTIIVKPLDDIDNITAPLAACRDTHSSFANNPYRKMCINHGHLLGWPIDKEYEYFNGGVTYAKDCQEAKDFYQRWNHNLNMGYKYGVYMDQPSFAKTNYEMGHIIEHLPDIWNCQLKHGIRYLKDAHIVHYLCTNPSVFQNKQLFLLNEKDVFLSIKRTGEISEEIEEVIKDPFKGLAEVTHCFAGDDIYFFHTDSYKYLRSRYKMGENSLQDKWLLFLKSIGYYKNRLLGR